MFSNTTQAGAQATAASAKHDLKSKVSSLKDEAYDTLDNATSDLQATAQNLGRKVRSAFDTASEEVTNRADQLNTRIHDHPLQSTLVAAGVGFLLGLLIRR